MSVHSVGDDCTSSSLLSTLSDLAGGLCRRWNESIATRMPLARARSRLPGSSRQRLCIAARRLGGDEREKRRVLAVEYEDVAGSSV